MAGNGKIIRNGAEIQIDENGNVVARPADGQEFIVEDDARVGTLEAEQASIGGASSDVHYELIDEVDVSDENSVSLDIDLDTISQTTKVIFSVSGGDDVFLRFDGLEDGNEEFEYWDITGTRHTDQDGVLLFENSSTSTQLSGSLTVSATDGVSSHTGLNIQPSPSRTSRINNLGVAGGPTGDTPYNDTLDFVGMGTSFSSVRARSYRVIEVI